MNLFDRVLRWAGAVPSRPPAKPKPETDWEQVECDVRFRYDHTVLPGCAYAQPPRREDGDEEVGECDRLWGYRAGQATGAERLVLDALAELAVCGRSSWDAARVVFGGAGVARDASRAALSATVAGEPAGSVPA